MTRKLTPRTPLSMAGVLVNEAVRGSGKSAVRVPAIGRSEDKVMDYEILKGNISIIHEETNPAILGLMVETGSEGEFAVDENLHQGFLDNQPQLNLFPMLKFQVLAGIPVETFSMRPERECLAVHVDRGFIAGMFTFFPEENHTRATCSLGKGEHGG